MKEGNMMADLAAVACVMTFARWGAENGRIASEDAEMD